MPSTYVFTMGRNQPYGHQHFAANDWMAEQLDADHLDIFIDTTHEQRLPKSPMLGETIIEAVEASYEDFYDTSYTVEAHERDVLDPSFYTDLLERGFQGYTFITGEQTHAKTLEKAMPGLSWAFDYDVEHWPRDADRFEGYDQYEIVSSSTEIRQMIREDNEDWRDAVSDPVEDAIDDDYEAIRESIMPEEDYDGSKYKDILASNGQPWSSIVSLHDRFDS